MKTFEEIKNECQTLIESNHHRIVDRTTNIHDAGIYMLYVDSFGDDKIIPFYIGQTNDFQKRYQQHLTEIMALNRCLRANYEYALHKNVYHGNYRACKIFSYMVEHNCTFDNLHMIILDIIEDENKRKIAEKRYIDQLKSPFVGFNQIHSVSMSFLYSHGNLTTIEFDVIRNSDVEDFIEYAKYGYNAFNWNISHAMFTQEQQDRVMSSVNGKVYEVSKQQAARLDEIHRQRASSRHAIDRCEDHIVEVCKALIIQFCQEHKIRLSYREIGLSYNNDDVVKAVVGIILFDIDSDKKDMIDHLKKYKYREDKLQELIDFVLSKHKISINRAKRTIEENQRIYRELEEERWHVLTNVFSPIFPARQYESHPLQDTYVPYSFPIDQPENSCYLNVEYTCFKSRENLRPEICKMDCCVKIGKETHIFSQFISNSLTNFFNSGFAYYEKDAAARMLFSRNPFNLRLYGDATTHIPVTMEYKNGINEFTLSSHEAKSAIDVFTEIDAIVPSDMKITYTTNGTKSAIKHCFKKGEIEQITFLKRLIKALK
jgi:hypothetical protein